MAPELSSNWKKLQAKIKTDSTKHAEKRKADDTTVDLGLKRTTKRQKVQSGPVAQTKPLKSKSPERKRTTKTSNKSAMGAVNSQLPPEPKPRITPSLALWAEDNDISTEDIAEAYGLGIKGNSMITATAVRPNEGLAKDVEVGKYIAIDCEMVGVGENGRESALARVSIVDFHGRQIYDSFVRPKERVVDWRTHVSGVSPKNMATARTFEEVKAQASNLMKGRIIVGHDIRHDLEALLLEHPRKDIRDTARFSGFRKYGHGPKPALRVLAREILGVEIHTGQHSSIEDARVAMLLFRRHKPSFDVEHATRYPDPAAAASQRKPNSGKKKKKKH